LFWAFTSSLAGFLFGFDTVVISGAEKVIQNLWKLSDALHGFAMASALWGTVVGSLLGAWPADRFGRKPTLLWIGILYLVSANWSGLSTDVYQLIAARFIGGLGIGVCTVAAPMYISEIAPPKYRGRLTGMFQFNIVFGILVAFLSNALLARIGEDAWRWMLGVVAIPAIIYSALCFRLPESPRWLIARKRDRAAGVNVLRQISPSASQSELDALADEISRGPEVTELSRSFWTRRLRLPILLAFLIAFFNQLSGINAVLYFAPRIFELTGLGEQAALLQSVGIGVTNLIFTFVGLWLIDHLGRRTLMLIGSVGYILSLGACAAAFYTGQYSVVPVCIFAFIAAHAVGQGAVIWVFISEIFPTAYRAAGQSLGSSTHWIFAALLTTFFPLAVSAFAPEFVFLFFTGMMVLQLVWVASMMPETKGVPLEELERKLGVVG
jgi:sugar porter (SP) family MFS transporter